MGQEYVLRSLCRLQASEKAEDTSEQLQDAVQRIPPTSTNFAPQLELVDGKLVPMSQSLVVQAQPEHVHMVVREYSNIVNNQSHSNRIRTANWTAEETEAFFCVSTPSSMSKYPNLLGRLVSYEPRKI